VRRSIRTLGRRPSRAGEGSRGGTRFLLSVLRLGRSDVRLGNAVGIASAAREGAQYPDTEEMPTAGLDPPTQAILCLRGIVPGTDPVVVLLGEAAAAYL
jgi:hypothetical protein